MKQIISFRSASLLLILLWSAVVHHSYGQVPANQIGANPTSLKWQQLNSDGYQLIYPEGLDSISMRMAALLDSRLHMDRSTVGHRTKKIPILLHPLNVRSNAFVTVGPYRSEFYGVAPQFKSPINWIDELTIHEYRHAEQFANSNKGITGIARAVLGSWAWGGMTTLVLPRWYFEGDAVIAETGLSSAGRGRFPEFHQEYHALLRDGVIYDYEKAAAGSYKDLVPSWYPLGYNMLSYGRDKYGANLWADVADDAVRYKGLIYPFGKSLKKHTGASVKELYYETMDDLKERWAEMDGGRDEQAALISPTDKSTVTHYNHPIPQPDGSVLAIREGYDRLSELIKIKSDGAIEKLTNMGIVLDGGLTAMSQHGSHIIWSAQTWSIRRANVTYSDLYTYDLVTGKKKRLTHKQRYYSPAYSPDGKYIAVISVNEELRQSLTLLNSMNGEQISSVEAYTFQELSYPVWINEQLIAYISTTNQQNAIRTYDIKTQKHATLLNYTADHISHLSYTDGRIYFAKADGMVNNAYSIKIDGSDQQQHTQSIIGAYQPKAVNGELYYSTFSSKGYDIVKQPLQQVKATKNKKDTPDLYAANMATQEGKNIVSQTETKHNHKHKKYSKWSGLLNPHSLLPEWAPPTVSVALLSDNVFGTLSANATATYNYNENEMSYSAGMTYAELYPILSANYGVSDRNAIFFSFAAPNDTTILQSVYSQSWNERRISGGVTIPFNFSQGNHSHRLNLTAQYTNAKLSLDDEVTEIRRDTSIIRPGAINSLRSIIIDQIKDQTLHQMTLRGQWSIFQFRARQNLNPRWGLYLDALYRSNINAETYGDGSLRVRGDIYMPGIRRNHSFYVNTAYQSENILSNYRYSDQFLYPRGYGFSLRRDRFYKVGFNYSFPIAYPDFAIGGLAFVKRLKANVFYDIGVVGIRQFPFTESNTNLSSTGIEFGIDFRSLRLVEVDLGIRYSYLLNKDFAPSGNQHQFDIFVVSLRPH